MINVGDIVDITLVGGHVWTGVEVVDTPQPNRDYWDLQYTDSQGRTIEAVIHTFIAIQKVT